MLFETSCSFFALLVKTVSRQETKNIRFCISMLLLTPSGVILRCELRSGPAGRDGPSLRALLLLAARKSQAMLHVLICFISQHFRGAAAQRKLELLRSAFCARLLRRYSRSNILVAAHVKAGTTFCGNQSFTLCFCCLRW